MNDENTVPASQASTVLNLSTDSGFYTDWKQEYQLDTEQAILSAGRTESIMLSTTRLISTLCTLLKLPHSVEFSSIDTLERFLVTVIDDAEGTSARNFVQQMPLYVFSVLSLVSKFFDAHVKLDPRVLEQILQQYAPNLPWSDKRMLELEFEVLKKLNYKIKHSLLLGAVERFSKEFILTLGIARKDFVGSIGVKLLRVVYAQKHHIYSSLRPSIKCEDMFVRFKSNKLILAAATVTAMLKFCGAVQERVVDQVVNQLSNECFVEPKNIIFLRDAILNVFN
ncbi:uncharacterized protein LOC131684574 isoform X1 [Topomyia yanbarensis]|uniref:uncharacterized protein LOC131684574 isoform X1 n=1 Tax=Topomyia yanbarensis TaxID=2498891 RepID=UPI00273BEFF8|nr:uncharacterized protein LOC131684574 isoform X1 [Topomyia yanbarensis]